MMKVYSRRAALMGWKPYDAEIEYLETRGNCRIRTNSVPSGSDIAISSKFMFSGYLNNSGWIPWYVAYTNQNTQTFRIMRDGSSNTTVRINNGAEAIGSNGDAQFTVSANGIYEIETNGREVTFNGVTKTGRVASSSLNTAKMQMMSDAFKGRCYYFKLRDGNTLLLDCIPVRVGNVGYMFDKVSGKLFGNAGTGNLILGPDK
jgi:hypothetical protein